jgi:dihydroorotate dehydrogenase
MLYPLFRPLLFTLDPETAHDVAFIALDAAVASGAAQLTAPRVAASPVVAMGLEFPNRIGLAAGLDKNAAHIDGLATLGFGFIECGTVTPRPKRWSIGWGSTTTASIAFWLTSRARASLPSAAVSWD